MEDEMSKEIIKNEKEFADWFKDNYKKLGFSKIVRPDISRCPDFIMLKDGKNVNVELETVASNFLVHKHDLDKVDEIICLVKDTELGKPITDVKELRFNGPRKVTLSIDSNVYQRYKKYCEENAIMLSKKIELFMKEQIDDYKE
ncbi:hypothetical protein GF336_05370 [Candidatus Woesearchaeota archaeon]|nr:hypothetical protein [Candidatus Woesearchaeota archaeon]